MQSVLDWFLKRERLLLLLLLQLEVIAIIMLMTILNCRILMPVLLVWQYWEKVTHLMETVRVKNRPTYEDEY